MIAIPAYSAMLFLLAAALGYFLALWLCRSLTPYDDGPEILKIPVFVTLAVAAIVGGAYGHLLANLSESLLMAPAIVVLTACLYTDAKTGLISERLMIPAIVIILGVAGWTHNVLPFIGAVCSGLPFAIFAFRSRGLAMGWGDVYLAVYAGALLGVPAILASALALIVMFFVAKVQQRPREYVGLPTAIIQLGERGGMGRIAAQSLEFCAAFMHSKPDKPVAFAPYLVSSYALAICLCS